MAVRVDVLAEQCDLEVAGGSQAPSLVDDVVERAGALCIQVLMSAAKSWEEDKHSFSFSKISDTLVKTMQLIGVNYDHLLAKESKS
jgi:anti-anti-sigma regulatory factor